MIVGLQCGGRQKNAGGGVDLGIHGEEQDRKREQRPTVWC